MDAGLNRTVGGHVENERGGPQLADAWKTYRAGESLVAVMTAPSTRLGCVEVGKHQRAEFLVKAPAGVTAWDLTWGRWVRAPGGAVAIEGWVFLGEQTYDAADGLLRVTPPFETHTDLIGAYISAITGVPAESFRLWFRGCR